MPKPKLLIIGYSSFARRRIIPSLKKTKDLTIVFAQNQTK